MVHCSFASARLSRIHGSSLKSAPRASAVRCLPTASNVPSTSPPGCILRKVAGDYGADRPEGVLDQSRSDPVATTRTDHQKTHAGLINKRKRHQIIDDAMNILDARSGVLEMARLSATLALVGGSTAKATKPRAVIFSA